MNSSDQRMIHIGNECQYEDDAAADHVMVSVIVPVYKVEKYLFYCLESLLNQSYRDIEIILVNDGSPDRSGALCDEYQKKDSRIRAIHKENGGVSSARNLGLDVAHGTYVVFVDSDDYVESDYVERLIAEQRGSTQFGHVWCCFQTVKGYQYEGKQVACDLEGERKIFSRNEMMSLHEMWLDTSLWNKIFRLDIIRDKNLRFVEGLSLGEDWLFNLAYLDAVSDTTICVITKPLYNYVRREAESLDHCYRSNMLDIYRRLNKSCEEYLQSWKVDDRQMQIFYNSRFYSYDKVLRNRFMNAKAKRRDIYAMNNQLLRSKEFKEVFARRTCYVNPLYSLGYKIGEYRILGIIDWIQNRRRRGKLGTRGWQS